MKAWTMIAALPVLALAACGSGSGTGGGNAASPAGPVAAAPPAGQQWADVVSKTADGGYRMGNPNAPVKLIEYGSRTCPHCAAFDKEGLSALKAGPIAQGKLSYEFRDFPVHAQLDIGPILLGQCVEPAQFFPMLDQMMANQQTLVYRTEKIPAADQAKLANASPSQIASYLAKFYGYYDFVKTRGVSQAKADACLSDQKALEAIAKGADQAGQQFQVSGTPTFIVNGEVAQNVNDWEQLQPILKTAGAM